MKILITFLVLATLTGCTGSYVSVSQGHLVRNNGFDGDDRPSKLTIGQKVYEKGPLRINAEWEHTSHLLIGVPFTKDQEDWFDAVYFEFLLEKK